MNTSCGDTVKCRLDPGKSPIFRSQSPCTGVGTVLGFRTYIYVRKSERVNETENTNENTNLRELADVKEALPSGTSQQKRCQCNSNHC